MCYDERDVGQRNRRKDQVGRNNHLAAYKDWFHSILKQNTKSVESECEETLSLCRRSI